MQHDLLTPSPHDQARALDALEGHPERLADAVPALVLLYVASEASDDVIASRAVHLLTSTLGEDVWRETLASVCALSTARWASAYADSGTYAKALCSALPAYLAVRARYEAWIVATPHLHEWYCEIGLACVWTGARDDARSFWDAVAFAPSPCRDALAELGFEACRAGDLDHAAACVAAMRAHFPDDEALPRLEARMVESAR